MEDIREFLTSALHLTDPGLIEAAMKLVKVRKYRKGSIILEQYEISNAYMLMVSGILRTYYVTDDSGSEITEAIVRTPGCCCTPSPDLSAPQPAGVQALTDSEIACFLLDDLKALGETYPEIFSIISQYMIRSWDYISQLKRIQYEMTTRERWLWFTETYPGLDEIMKLQDIASFLNMTLGNLSRVRKQLAEEQTKIYDGEEGLTENGEPAIILQTDEQILPPA